jgi:hypothetical protein
METQNYIESFDDFSFDYDSDFDIDIDIDFDIDSEIDNQKVYLDDYRHCYVERTLFYLVKAVLNHRINQLDKDLIHSADDLLGEYFKDDIDGEDQLALCCLERLIELGQLPIMEIPRNDENDRKYILL